MFHVNLWPAKEQSTFIVVLRFAFWTIGRTLDVHVCYSLVMRECHWQSRTSIGTKSFGPKNPNDSLGGGHLTSGSCARLVREELKPIMEQLNETLEIEEEKVNQENRRWHNGGNNANESSQWRCKLRGKHLGEWSEPYEMYGPMRSNSVNSNQSTWTRIFY